MLQTASAYCHENAHKIRTYSKGFTYIVINADNDSILIFDKDKSNHHPVLPHVFFRGKFKIDHLKGDMYIMRSELPGKKCFDNIALSRVENSNDSIDVHFSLGTAKNKYTILAKNVATGSVAQISYQDENMLTLPCSDDGYVFAIVPEESAVMLTGLCYGFQHTIKFLNFTLPGNQNLFASGATIDVSLPLFRDDIFYQWCVDSDIINISTDVFKDMIIWHCRQFLPCKYETF